MKIKCSVEKLKTIINLLNRITIKKDQNEILSSIFFEVVGNILKIKASNLSIGIEFSVIVESDQEGSFSVLSQNIQQLFSSFQIQKSDEFIFLALNDKILEVTYKKNKIKLKINQQTESPTLPFIKEESFVIEKDLFKKGIESVLYSASRVDIKPELASIFIHQNDGNLVFVTTDTFRLTEYRVQATKEYSFPTILLPIKNASEIVKVLQEIEEDAIEVYPTKNQISFLSKSVFITSQLINGVFPDYIKIIPSIKHSTSHFLKTDLLEVLKTASSFTDIRNQIKISFDTKDQIISVFCENDIMGQFSGSASAKIVGDTFELLLNKNYLEECLNQFGETIEVTINQPSKPIMIKSKQNPEITSLLMPMSK